MLLERLQPETSAPVKGKTSEIRRENLLTKTVFENGEGEGKASAGPRTLLFQNYFVTGEDAS